MAGSYHSSRKVALNPQAASAADFLRERGVNLSEVVREGIRRRNPSRPPSGAISELSLRLDGPLLRKLERLRKHGVTLRELAEKELEKVAKGLGWQPPALNDGEEAPPQGQ